MAYPENLSYENDNAVWNETETVTYFSKTTEAIPASGFSLQRTLWTTIDREATAGDQVLSKFTFRVQIAGVYFPTSNVPKKDDLMLRSNGTRWVIGKIEGPDPTDYDIYVTQDFSYGQSLRV